MQSGFQVLKYHCKVEVNEMTHYQVPRKETSIKLTNISEQVYCYHGIPRNIYFGGLLFTSHWLNLQHWTSFYIAVYGNFQGLFFIFEGSFLHFGGEIARSPRVIFPLQYLHRRFWLKKAPAKEAIIFTLYHTAKMISYLAISNSKM